MAIQRSKSHENLLAEVVELAKWSAEAVHTEYKSIPWHDAETYGNWLAQTHYYVKKATRLLAYAAARCTHDEEKLHLELLKGAAEEKGHEILALNDLRQLGFDLEQFPELPETKAYHQTLYFAIDHSGPAALIGYFLPLEGLAGQKVKAEYQEIVRLYSFKGASFLKVHCELDVTHFDEGLKLLSKLTERQLIAVREGIMTSVPLYRGIMHALIAQARPAKLRTSA